MPSRRQLQNKLTKAEERKRRQEKFRKRSPSLFSKAKLLAKDTDAWVALVVRDRAGRVRSFRSSDSLYWPPSAKDLIKKHPGIHEFLEKRVISGCWKVVGDESHSTLVDDDTDSFVGDIRTMRMTSVETVETVGSTKLPVDALEESDSILTFGLGESEGTAVHMSKESNCTTEDATGESSVKSIRELYNATNHLDRGPDGMTVEHVESGNNIDVLGAPNNTILDIPAESDNTIVHLLGDSDNAPDVSGKAVAMDVPNTIEAEPTTSEHNMDLNLAGAKSKVETEVREGELIETANVPYTTSQHHSPQPSEGLGSWQVVHWTGMLSQDDRQGWGSKSSTGIDPKELLEKWNWVFQRE